jgi:CheY-like chemotaxis protein/signal transduction histidine kinase/HAMP domain-containing protein
MRWNDLKIGTQLHLALSLILALVVVLGILAWRQTNQLWLNTKFMYDHPVQVSQAIGYLKVDMEKMSTNIRDLFLAREDQEVTAALQGLEVENLYTERRFAVLFDRYLGPPSDLTTLSEEIAKWKVIRDETVRLFMAGERKKAATRIEPDNIQDSQSKMVKIRIKMIDDFAQGKAKQLYLDATTQYHNLVRQLFAIVTAILLLSLLIIWLLLKGVKNPLVDLTATMEQFRQGKLDIRSQHVSANEIGTLVSVFNSMAEMIQMEVSFKESMARLNAVMVQQIEARTFCLLVLEPLMQLTGSQVGAIYLLNDQKTDYEHLESIGLDSAKGRSFSSTAREGEFGAALITQQIQHLTTIPADTPFTFAAVSGDFMPREIITIPLGMGEDVSALISLASLHCYDAVAVRLVTDIQAAMTAWMNSMLSIRRIQSLTEGLEHQNQELLAQQEELRAANEELEEQSRQLHESEEKLRIQQEELEVTNEELEEKNGLLEKQKQKVESAQRELEEKAAALALASKYKSEFLANMSHELRTPLNSLLLLSQGLERNREGNLTEEQVESARIIHGSGSDLLTLINEILDLSKIEARRTELQLGAIRISDLVEGVHDSFQHLANEKGIELKIIVTDEVPTEIVSDRKRVEQILRNLISNALKFTERGGVTVTFGRAATVTDLAVSGLSAQGCLAVAIKDTGIGIAPEQHQVIFEAFRQADGSTSRKYGGTGLGLSISRELASLLGGEIQLESKPGSGSTFTLYLPIELAAREQKVETPAPDRAQTVAVEGEKQGSQLQIPDDRDRIAPSDRVMLIIEDDPNFARLLYGKCSEKGFKCLTAPTGEAGLELVTKHLPSAVILDLHLPGMDGWKVLSSLKEDTRTRHIPVHIISVEEASNESLRKGAVGHITKPVKLEELEEVFRKLDKMSPEKPKRLLVVDDDPLIRRQTVKLIGNGVVKTDEAGSGEEALVALRSGGYDCVVLDLGLPDMDGGDLLTQLENEGVALPPVVVYTARDLTMEEEALLREHAESIVIKDVRSQERLLDEVSLFLHRVVSQMPEKKQKVIHNLHDIETVLKDKKVLVVDDDMRTTFAVAHLLADSGMKPVKAVNGEKALQLLDEQPDIDLVLMDIMMPVMDGYETMRRIRIQDRFRNLPIIVLTAKAMPEDRKKCLAAGANDYLPKPLDQDRLFSMMRVWLCR